MKFREELYYNVSNDLENKMRENTTHLHDQDGIADEERVQLGFAFRGLGVLEVLQAYADVVHLQSIPKQIFIIERHKKIQLSIQFL